MRGDFSAARSAATAAGCQQYAGTRGTKARSGAGAGAELPPSRRGSPEAPRDLSVVLRPVRPEPGSVRGAGVVPPGAEICPWCWGRSARSRDLSAVLGSVRSEPRSVRGAGAGPAQALG